MPRDNDKDNDSRGRRDRPGGGKSGGKGPFRRRARTGEEVCQAGLCRQGRGCQARWRAASVCGQVRRRQILWQKTLCRKTRRRCAAPPRFNREDRPRGDRPFGDRPPRSGDGEKRTFKPRGDRPNYRDDRGGEKRPYTPRGDRPDRGDARPAARFSDRKFGDKKPYTPRERDGEKRPYTPRGDRPNFDRGDCTSGRALLGQEVRRQETLRAA